MKNHASIQTLRPESDQDDSTVVRRSDRRGVVEYALNEIVEEQLDLSVFEHRYHNDATGRSAYDAKVLLKVVLYGYYRGFVSSRRIAEACRRNVLFMALSADSRPHFTTIAAFVSSLEHEITSLFGDVLLYASELGLIGKEHFAVDGCKLPSNASKKWSGTHKELEKKRQKLEQVLATACSCSSPRTVVSVLGPPCLVAAVFGLTWVWTRFAVRGFLRHVGRNALAQH